MVMPARNQRGYTTTELMTVVAIIGIITAIATPAIMQLVPQYRMKSASSEITASIRLARQSAMTMRRPWMITFDASGTRYALYMLNSPTASMTTSANWTQMGINGRPLPAGTPHGWRKFPAMTMTTSNLNNVDSANGVDVIFLRDGSISSACYSASPASVRLHYDTNLIPFNTFYARVESGGYVYTSQTKE